MNRGPTPAPAAEVQGCVAYVTAVFPARSETFVYREVRGLRTRGWRVVPVTLRPPEDDAGAEFADLRAGRLVAYRPGQLGRSLLECLTHPLAAARTLLRAGRDLLFPGEAMRLAARLRLLVQAVFALGLAHRLRRAGVRHVHCHFAHAPTGVGMYAAMQLLVPFSFTGHANDLFQRRALLGRKLERAAFVACISHWHAAWYAGMAPEVAARCRVIRCGVDMAEWQAQPTQSSAGRALRLLTVCRLIRKKGVDTVIEAVARLQRPVELTVAGDGPERQRLEELARRCGCADRIRFVGAVANDAVRRLMGATDVVVLACRTDAAGDMDGVPVVLIEAMASGLATISGDLPAIRELIDDGVNGVLVPGDDPAALAARIEQLDDAQRADLGRAARTKVADEFSLATTLQRLEAALRQR